MNLAKWLAIEKMIKRLLDIAGSTVLILLLLPLYLIIGVVLKLSQEGPLLFIQERIGKHGKPFNIYKFRSMKLDSEIDGQPKLSSANDSRLTTAGRFLRKHHLDELPQLWNVLIGDMSFVGPRPERRFYIDQIMARNPRYVELYQVRPGLTSYATLYNGYTDTMEKMLRRLDMDLDYIEHRSIWTDTKIILLTVKRMIIGE